MTRSTCVTIVEPHKPQVQQSFRRRPVAPQDIDIYVAFRYDLALKEHIHTIKPELASITQNTKAVAFDVFAILNNWNERLYRFYAWLVLNKFTVFFVGTYPDSMRSIVQLELSRKGIICYQDLFLIPEDQTLTHEAWQNHVQKTIAQQYSIAATFDIPNNNDGHKLGQLYLLPSIKKIRDDLRQSLRPS